MTYLKQGKLNVGKYVNEFEKLTLLGAVEESKEQNMARFTSGLNSNILGKVELYICFDFDAIYSLSLKVEVQRKANYVESLSVVIDKPKPWMKVEASAKATSTPAVLNSFIVTLKADNANNETILSKIRFLSVKGLDIIRTRV